MALALALQKRDEREAVHRVLSATTAVASETNGSDNTPELSVSLAYAYHCLAEHYAFHTDDGLTNALKEYANEQRLLSQLSVEDVAARGSDLMSRRFWLNHNYGMALAKHGDVDEAIEMIDGALKIAEERTDIAEGKVNLEASYARLVGLLVSKESFVEVDALFRRANSPSLKIDLGGQINDREIARWLLNRGAALTCKTKRGNLVRCPNLESLPDDVDRVTVIDWYQSDVNRLPLAQQIGPLRHLQQLISINLGQNPSRGDEMRKLVDSLSELKQIQTIYLNRCDVALPLLEPLIGHPTLSRLIINQTPAANAPKLPEFRLAMAPCIVLATPSEIASYYLFLRGAKPNLRVRTNDGLTQKIKHESEFPLQGFELIEFAPDPSKPLHKSTMEFLMPQISTLERIDFRGHPEISAAAFHWLKRYTHVREIDLSDTKLSKDDLDQLRASLPQCKILSN